MNKFAAVVAILSTATLSVLSSASQVSDADTPVPDFTVQPVGDGKPFRLAEARGQYVALHFLLKTECPICLRYTRDYARNARKVPDVQHVFLKPDSAEETAKWFSKYPKDDPDKPTIYRDPDAELAKRFNIPHGYKFHGQVVHYPAFILIDPDGKEAFRYVGKSTFDRFTFAKFKKKMAALPKPTKLRKPAKLQKPNVLFIAVDDLNDWTGCLGGYPGVLTPNIDRLAARGLLFTHAYCSAPACNPSRASLLTGIRPSTSGVYHNNQPWRPALPNAVTLPQHFMANGYHVVGGGKIFHGRFNDPASWHTYFQRPRDPVPPNRPVNGIPKTAHFDWGPLDVPDDDMSDAKVTGWAIQYLQQKHDKPFFLAVGLFRPHLPWYVPRKHFDRYPLDKIILPKVKDDDLDDIPPIGLKMAKPGGDHKRVLESNNWHKAVRGYLASITFTDTLVGRLIDALDNSPYARNTIIVLWTDHGWHLGEKKHWRKFALWEEATRVPMIFVVPGLTQPRQRCDQPVSLLDIYPTLARLAHLPPNDRLEGTSLLPLLKNPAAETGRAVVTTHGRNNHAVRSKRYRYIRYKDGAEELYDHDNDPMEWNNLADKPHLQAVKKQLAARLPKQNVKDAPRRSRRNAPAR